MIQIMKASAGSGKTFNLARKYITLLFRKNEKAAYRHILAVTFTNKATDEMKNRILRELHILSVDPLSSGYLKWFMPEMFPESAMKDVEPDDIVRELPGRPGAGITIDSLRSCAKEMLCGILHDYSAFSVSTIDRFFQQTLKAFSREIGQFSSYQVELDKKLLVRESVDRLLDSLTEDNPDLLKWLTECAMEQVENGDRYDIDKRLYDMAVNLKSDAYRELVESCGIDESQMYSYDNLKNLRTLCKGYMRKFQEMVRTAAQAALDAMSTCGLGHGDFYRGFTKVLEQYAAMDMRSKVEASAVFLSRASDPDLWFTKAVKSANMEKARGLESRFGDFCSLFEAPFKTYNTAGIILRQLYELGVSADIEKEFSAVLKENNVLSIDDSNLILKNIIDGSDAPFIYEKTGVRYENFLLDEFQDTSSIQWENFRPLLDNSNAQGFENLVVGDVKQSIYRWRGSEWRLLQEEIEKEMSPCRTTVLGRNFRSLENIVGFNNSFFRFAAGMLDLLYGDDSGTISGIYSDVVQETVQGREGGKGFVDVSFCDPDCQETAILDTVRELVSGGAGYGDIAVLVRNNSSGGAVAESFIRNGIPVVTDDSLKVKSSGAVRRIVSLLAYIDDPHDAVGSYLAGPLKAESVKKFRSLTNLCEMIVRLLREHDAADVDGEATYIQSFVDCVLDYSSRHGNSLHDFLEYWNSSETDPDISSPAAADAVRIITVHKSKGLDFNYVIFPFAETVKLYRPSDVWCCPELAGTELETAVRSVFDVRLSEASRDTFFEEDFLEEKKMQYIDNLNIFYVAFTRAVKGMHIIAAKPSGTLMKSLGNVIPAISDMSHVLYVYLDRNGVQSGFRVEDSHEEAGRETWRLGEMHRSAENHAHTDVMHAIESSYPSYPLNRETDDEGPEVRNRLVFSTENSDYFTDDGRVGLYSSGRLRGVILHRILSSVYKASDVRNAVREAVVSGFLEERDAGEAAGLLESMIGSTSEYGWFDEDCMILNETSVIDSDGQVYRPDRVMVKGDGSVVIVDYKFGAREKSHGRQILKYADIWRRRGYGDVSSYLWYVMEGEIVRTS